MRVLGHPIHVMLIHFPVALWPAHWALHVLSRELPAGTAATAGFWLLVAGSSLGWLAAFAGLGDLIELSDGSDRRRFHLALTHAIINTLALVAFSTFTVIEYAAYPEIKHGVGFLGLEAALLALLLVGNYFGGSVVWNVGPAKSQG